jgi:2-C-methyl-D-erythritol 4-phosphate cytidylyltransferase
MTNIPPSDADGVSALILGAGEGIRLGRIPKAFLCLEASTLLERAVRTVAPSCQEIVVGLREADLAAGRALIEGLNLVQPVTLIAGGAERQDTLARLVAHARNPFVLLHEVARPFACAEHFSAVLLAAYEHGAAALYTELAVRDGLAIMEGGVLQRALPRAQVVALQTPHAYRREILLDAHNRARQQLHREDSTVALVQWAGYSVKLVKGSADNLKITYPEDWARAQAARR